MTRIKTSAEAAPLRTELAKPQTVALILLGAPGSKAEKVYELAETMTFEDWEKVYLVESRDALGGEADQNTQRDAWFPDDDEDRYVCIYANTGKFTSGDVSVFDFRGRPDEGEIGTVIGTVPV